MTLIRDFVTYQRRRHLSDGTVTRRALCLRSVEAAVAPRSLTEVTSEDLERFLDGRQLGPRTRYCWISHLHTFYVWAIRTGVTGHDPTAVIDRPRLQRQLPRPIRDEDLAMAIRQADPTMKAWLCLAAYGGLRCAEISGLSRDDVMEGEDLIRVLGKGRRERLIPLHPLVLERLRLAGMPRTGLLFVRPIGKPFTPAQVSRRIALHLDDLAIDATAHQLRHWFGSRAYQQCCDIRVVQELLGHSSPTTTAIYTAFSPGIAGRAVASLPRLA